MGKQSHESRVQSHISCGYSRELAEEKIAFDNKLMDELSSMKSDNKTDCGKDHPTQLSDVVDWDD